ncbi:MAG: hypothetical protein LAT84_00265 [Balneolia bacterium]|nr:hypothetical protein [Balneolia bacterium]
MSSITDKLSISRLISALFYPILAIGIAGCGSSSQAPAELPSATIEAPASETMIPEDESWTLLTGEPRFLRPRTWNLHHQAAKLAFDFEREAVMGTTELMFTNLRGTSRELILDSKTTEFESIRISGSDEELTFAQDSAIVTINLNRNFARNDTLNLTIDFVSFPPSRGLYFVDPRNQDPTKPTQIWTLGQPEDNSFWLPTIDHPAERTTQEFWITVPDSMSTLANGFLISSQEHPETGERTDYWKLDLPHTPYLFALAVGVFEVTDRWVDDVYYAYYTESMYAPYKELIYDQTEDIMRYFNEKFDYPYPWGSYAQVPVHDFIARGMENTTATILYNLVQFDERGSQDLSNLALIVHELVHQWFGNLVTTKDWANLPFNEGFANYFEILYKKDMVSYDSGVWHSLGHKHDYFAEAARYRRPIIFNQYTESEDMYDRHTYAKSGQVLGMLHDMYGDDLWWSAMQNLLRTFEYQAVDMRDVQHIFEQETGESLHWFFDQWFYEPGHPELLLVTETDEDLGSITLNITQTQNTELQPVFRMHTHVDVVTETGSERRPVKIDHIESSFTFEADSPIVDLIFDPKGIQLVESVYELSKEQLRLRLEHDEPAVRFYALRYIDEQGLAVELTSELITFIRQDNHHELRANAMEILSTVESEEILEFALEESIYENQPLFRTRMAALSALRNFSADEENIRTRLKDAISDTSYFVSAHAKRLYAANGYDDSYNVISKYADAYSWNNVTREAVVDAMILINDKSSHKLLIEMAGHPGEVRYKTKALQFLQAADLSSELKEDAFKLYAELLQDPYENNRINALRGLASLNTEDAIILLNEYQEQTRTEAEAAFFDELELLP